MNGRPAEVPLCDVFERELARRQSARGRFHGGPARTQRSTPAFRRRSAMILGIEGSDEIQGDPSVWHVRFMQVPSAAVRLGRYIAKAAPCESSHYDITARLVCLDRNSEAGGSGLLDSARPACRRPDSEETAPKSPDSKKDRLTKTIIPGPLGLCSSAKTASHREIFHVADFDAKARSTAFSHQNVGGA